MSIVLSNRLDHLGTETAYAVAKEAAELAATGRRVLNFHIGDLNFRTAPHVTEACIKALHDGKTGYCPAAGVPALRAAMAATVSRDTGAHYTADNVSIQPGGKPVIWKFLAVVANAGDGVLYPTPGYPIYESQIDYLGCVAQPYFYIEDVASREWRLDLARLRASITPATRVLILNNPSNPMGTVCSDAEIAELAALCVQHNLVCLSDDAYCNILYDGVRPRHIVSYAGMEERTAMLYTFSKSFSMTGWRLGACLGPKKLVDAVNKLNTNDEACTTHFVQCAGVEALQSAQSPAYIADLVAELDRRRKVLVRVLNEVKGFRAFMPQGAFYVFVNVTAAMAAVRVTKLKEFRLYLLNKLGVSVCARSHFGRKQPGETEMYLRFAYSGVSVEQIEEAGKILKEHFNEMK